MIHQTIVDYLCNLINIDTTINSNNEIEGILYIKEVFDKIGIENKAVSWYNPIASRWLYKYRHKSSFSAPTGKGDFFI